MKTFIWRQKWQCNSYIPKCLQEYLPYANISALVRTIPCGAVVRLLIRFGDAVDRGGMSALPPPLPVQTASPAPLSSAQIDQLAHARRAARKALGPAKAAAFNGWSCAICSALCLPFALFSGSALMMCVGLAVVAFNELRGRKRILAFDHTAATMLGFNQLGLIGLVTVYCAWSLIAALTGPNPFAEQIASTPELAQMLGPIAGLHRTLSIITYSTIIALTAIFQGLTALYYFRRARHIQRYVAAMPDWIIAIQRAA